MAYELWWAPTLKGQQAFGWKHRLLGVYDDSEYEDASLICYIKNVEDPAPDDRDYSRFVLIGPV